MKFTHPGSSGLSPATAATAFVRSRFFVASTIVRATNLDQLIENIDAVDVELAEPVLEEIDAIHQRYCNPAPKASGSFARRHIKCTQAFDTVQLIIHNPRLRSEGFPSGQRGQTVNLLAQPSEVRILPPPPAWRPGLS